MNPNSGYFTNNNSEMIWSMALCNYAIILVLICYITRYFLVLCLLRTRIGLFRKRNVWRATNLVSFFRIRLYVAPYIRHLLHWAVFLNITYWILTVSSIISYVILFIWLPFVAYCFLSDLYLFGGRFFYICTYLSNLFRFF